MNLIKKLQKMIDKSEHKFLKDVYLGRRKAIVIKRKGLRKDSSKRKLLEFVLNRAYLKSYGKIKQEIMNKMIFGKPND